MNRYASFSLRALLGLSIVLTLVATSQAGLFRQWRTGYTYYYYPTYVPPAVTPAPATAIAPAAQAAVVCAVPTVYTVAKPVVTHRRRARIPAAAGVSRHAAPGTSVDFHRIPTSALFPLVLCQSQKFGWRGSQIV